jgi:hypothetical protein
MDKFFIITGGVVLGIFLIGFFPTAAVAVTALGIVFLFLVFGKDSY